MSPGKRPENKPAKWRLFLQLVRTHQWIKNTVVVLPMLFSGSLFDAECWNRILIAFVCFCMASSSVYCINDIMDAAYDRMDMEKRHRPVASGGISITEAILTGITMAALSLTAGWLFLPEGCIMILAAYIAMNILYCLWLKHIMLLDVMIVAIGFVLRVVMGGVAAGIWVSQWIIIMMFLLALFLALAKRRHEVVLVSGSEKKSGRKSVSGYTLPFLNASLSMLSAVLIIGYIIYTLQPRHEEIYSEYLYITALPVIFGLLRYLQLTIVENRSGDPTRIVCSDHPILIAAFIWLLSFTLIIYL